MGPGDSIYDADKSETIPVERIRAALSEYTRLFQYLEDWDNGAFTMTEQDYLSKPALLMEIRRLFKQRKADFLAPKTKGKK